MADMYRDGRMDRWPSYLNVLAGLWIIVSPWVLGFSDDSNAALWSSIIVGVVVVVFGVLAIATRFVYPNWVNAIAGVWLIVSPYVLNYDTLTSARNNHLVLGIVVLVLSAIALALQYRLFGGRATSTDRAVDCRELGTC